MNLTRNQVVKLSRCALASLVMALAACASMDDAPAPSDASSFAVDGSDAILPTTPAADAASASEAALQLSRWASAPVTGQWAGRLSLKLGAFGAATASGSQMAFELDVKDDHLHWPPPWARAWPWCAGRHLHQAGQSKPNWKPRRAQGASPHWRISPNNCSVKPCPCRPCCIGSRATPHLTCLSKPLLGKTPANLATSCRQDGGWTPARSGTVGSTPNEKKHLPTAA